MLILSIMKTIFRYINTLSPLIQIYVSVTMFRVSQTHCFSFVFDFIFLNGFLFRAKCIMWLYVYDEIICWVFKNNLYIYIYIHQIHQIFNESKQLFFTYKYDRIKQYSSITQSIEVLLKLHKLLLFDFFHDFFLSITLQSFFFGQNHILKIYTYI